MVETEEELYSRKAALLKRALTEADRLDKVDADLQASENLETRRVPVDRELPMPTGPGKNSSLITRGLYTLVFFGVKPRPEV